MTKLERLKKRQDLYYKAEEAVLTGQEYRMGTRSLRRADLKEIKAELKEIGKEIDYLEKGGKNRAFRGLPLDI